MNITPDGTPRRAPFGRELNDLNSPGRVVSIEDNTVDPVFHTNQKRLSKRRFTLSLVEKDLEDARKLVASKIEQKVFGDNTGTINKEFKEKEKFENDTGTWQNSDADSEELNKDAKHKEQVYAKYVQEGDRNLMLIYEAKDSKSGVYVKQLGNKNVVVHLNVSSNLCQLIDPINKGIIPLDSEGEVWLEIKRRSQMFPEKSDSSDGFSSSDNNSVSGESISKGRKQQTSDDSRKQACEHTDSVYESHINIRRCPVEHTESCDEHIEARETENDSMDGQDESIYFIKKKEDSLYIKFSRWSQSSALNMKKLQDSPILSHRKVIEFLTDRGNNFDVNICDWEYETESVYSYISDEQIGLMELEDGYSKVMETTKDSPVNQDEENYTLYARPNKQPSRKTPHSGKTESLEAVSISAPNKSPVIPNKQLPRTKHHSASTDSLEVESPSAPNKSPVIPKRSISDDPDSGSERNLAPPIPTRSVTNITKNLPRNPISSNPTYISEPDINNDASAMNTDSVQEKPIGKTPSIDYRQRTTWDHGDIDKSEAKRRLQGKPHGSFLVRAAATGLEPNHVYTIELLDEGQFKKLMIMKTGSLYHFNEFRKQKFDSMEKLIETILKSGVEVKDTITGNWKTISVKPVPP